MKILKINSSSNKTSSTSTQYANSLVEKLLNLNPDASVKERHTTYSNLTFIDQNILGALFVNGERTQEQKAALELSDTLVSEIIEADVLVISTPIYNFSVHEQGRLW